MKKPNILFVCSDQQHWQKNSVNGHSLVRTPHMERLARMGINFRSCYSNSPVCVPSRASLFSGLYPHEVGAYDNAAPLRREFETFGTLARSQNYDTFATGKLDFYENTDYGFKEVDTNHSHDRSPDIGAYCRKPLVRRPADMISVRETLRTEESRDRSTTRRAIEFLRSSVRKEKPWLSWCGWMDPHDPYKSTLKYLDHYPLENIDLPDLPEGWQKDEHPVIKAKRYHLCLEKDVPEQRIRTDRAAYYGMIMELDEQLGELIDTLETTGQLENTIIIYSSDHGDMIGEHGLYFKNAPYDHCARVPLIIAGGPFSKGGTIDTPVSLVDVYATIADLVGAEPIKGCRGRSLVPNVSGNIDTPPYVFMELNTESLETGVFTIIKGNWKYNYYVGFEDQLFNLEEDPNEWNNLVEAPQYKKKIQEMKKILFSVCNPENVSKEAFEDQGVRLRKMSGLGKRELDKALADKEFFYEFEKRLGRKGSVAFLTDYFNKNDSLAN